MTDTYDRIRVIGCAEVTGYNSGLHLLLTYRVLESNVPCRAGYCGEARIKALHGPRENPQFARLKALAPQGEIGMRTTERVSLRYGYNFPFYEFYEVVP